MIKAHELIASLGVGTDDYKQCLESIKFDLGDSDQLKSLSELATGDFCDIPFDVCMFQFSANRLFCIALAKKMTGGALFKMFASHDSVCSGQWFRFGVSAFVHNSSGITFYDELKKSHIHIPKINGSIRFDLLGPDQKLPCEYLHMFVAAVEVFSCSNIKTIVNDPPAKLNKKRIKNGKLPFFSYHTLHITGEYSKSEPKGGSHASPRLHLRRGHIRRLPNGSKIWVSKCIVGDKTKGFVSKDYRVSMA